MYQVASIGYPDYKYQGTLLWWLFFGDLKTYLWVFMWNFGFHYPFDGGDTSLMGCGVSVAEWITFLKLCLSSMEHSSFLLTLFIFRWVLSFQNISNMSFTIATGLYQEVWWGPKKISTAQIALRWKKVH